MEEKILMITVKDHFTGLLFDFLDHIGPKRRKLLNPDYAKRFFRIMNTCILCNSAINRQLTVYEQAYCSYTRLSR